MRTRLFSVLAALAPMALVQGCIIYADGKQDTGFDDEEREDTEIPPDDTDTSDTADTADTADPDDTGDSDDDTGGSVLDADGDGWTIDEDCDDSDPDVNPDAEEICNDGIDNDCDGLATGCRLEGEHTAVDVADTIFQGASSDDRFGVALTGAGDVDADGAVDILIARAGSPGGNKAAVHLFRSPTSGLVNAGAADATLHSVVSGDGLGIGMTALGDMDGDGYGDFAVGAPFAPANAVGEESDWAVYVFSGPMTGDAAVTTAEAWFAAQDIGDLTGWRLGSPGDVTGDGVVDLLIASPSAHVSPGDAAGKVWLMEGPWRREEALSDAVAVFTGELAGSRAGAGAATTAGDVDGDGREDMLMSSPDVASSGGVAGQGAAYVVTSAVSGQIDLRYADARIYGLTGGDRFGASATHAGDVNGDGYADILVGAPDSDLGASDAGAAYLFHGGSDLSGPLDAGDADFILLGARANGETGIAVSAVGDMDGDGKDDFAVSDPVGVDSAGLGVVAVTYGPAVGNTDIEDADLVLVADDANINMGGSIAHPGDTDDDGLGELLIGASLLSPSGAPSAGGAYLVRGTGF